MKQLNQLNVGDKVLLGTYGGKRIPWVVAGKGVAGYPSGSVTLITENVVASRVFDDTSTSGALPGASSYGKSWPNSQIKAWLNGGFIGGFTDAEKGAIVQSTVTCVADEGDYQTVSDTVKVFLPSMSELGYSGPPSTGQVLSLFSDKSNLAADYNGSPSYDYWTRDAVRVQKSITFYFLGYYLNNSAPSFGNDKSLADPTGQSHGVRPMVNVAGTSIVTDTAYDGYYGMNVSGIYDRLEFRLANPIETDAAASAATLNVVRSIPSTFTFSAKICNNGFDASPAWVDATANASGEGSIGLSNQTKTADKWGIDVLIEADRTGIDGNAWVSAVQGTYV